MSVMKNNTNLVFLDPPCIFWKAKYNLNFFEGLSVHNN